MQLYLSQIRTDGGTQPRAQIDQWTVQEYAAAMQDGAVFPPIIVFYDGSDYWLADGFHRYHARSTMETNFIDADVRQGTRDDAVWFACGANATHGLRRTNADKRRAVETALQLPKGAKQSDGAIAQHCAVSQPFVSKLRDELRPTHNDYESPVRTGADGRTINTTNIGKHAAQPEPTPEPEPFAQTTIDDFLPSTDLAADMGMDDDLMEDVFIDAGDDGSDEYEDDEYEEEPVARVVTAEVVTPVSPLPATIAVTNVNAMIAANLARQPETIAAPFAEYLDALNDHIRISDTILAAWFSTCDDDEWDMCERTFAGVERFFARVRAKQLTQRRTIVNAGK